MRTEFKLFWNDETNTWEAVNAETGEVKSFDIPKKTTRKKKVVDDDPTPRLILIENKYQFNNAAVELMRLEPDDRIDIKYEKRKGNPDQPVIGSDEVFGTQGGNRLTKSFTVACKGKNRERLEQFGTTFEIASHPEKDGLFILKGDLKLPENTVNVEDLNVKSSEEIEEINLADFTDETDDNKEIDLNNFDLEYGI